MSVGRVGIEAIVEGNEAIVGNGEARENAAPSVREDEKIRVVKGDWAGGYVAPENCWEGGSRGRVG